MSVDFEKIRLDVVKEFQSKLVETNSFADKLTPVLIDKFSKITKEMLIKYHETK